MLCFLPVSCPPPVKSPRLNILIVDDEPSIGEIFRALLAPMAHNVVFCRSGVEAFQRLQNASFDFDLLITDHHMPGSWSGLELVRIARAKGLRVPVLVASGHLTPKLVADYRTFDIMGLLPKPFDLQRIMTTVREMSWPAPHDYTPAIEPFPLSLTPGAV